MLAPLLCPKDGDRSAPFEIKVDNVCFAGYPWRSAGSSRNLAVVFALPGSVESHVVESFQNLSKKIATAIQSEQLRCNYLRQQIAIMQPVHDEVETMSDEHRKRSPYPTILGEWREHHFENAWHRPSTSEPGDFLKGDQLRDGYTSINDTELTGMRMRIACSSEWRALLSILLGEVMSSSTR